jgi:hypothetical protein
LKKINKIDKSLANKTKIRRKKTQIGKIGKIRNKKGEIKTNTKGIIRNFLENIYSHNLENLEETDKFLDTYDNSKLNQEDINYLNRSTTCNEIEAAIKSLQKKSPGPDEFSCEFYRTFKEEPIVDSVLGSLFGCSMIQKERKEDSKMAARERKQKECLLK